MSMSKYVFVADICKHEDYPCCGCCKDGYPMKRERANELVDDGLIKILGEYNPVTDEVKWYDDEESDEISEDVKQFVEYLKTNPLIETKREQHAFEDKYFDLVGGLDYDETVKTIEDVEREIKNQSLKMDEYISYIWEIFHDTDWTPESEFW